MCKVLFAAAALLAGAASADQFSVEVTPSSVHLEAGQQATFTIVTKVVSGNPAPVELVHQFVTTPSGRMQFLYPDNSAADIENGALDTTIGQTRTLTLRAPDDAHSGVHPFSINAFQGPDLKEIGIFTGATIYIDNGLIATCPMGYHENGNSCEPDAIGCASATSGLAFLALPLLLLLRRRAHLAQNI